MPRGSSEIGKVKTKLIKDIMQGARRFNEKHRFLSGIVMAGALVLIFLISVVFGFADAVWSLIKTLLFKDPKRSVGVILGVFFLILIAVIATHSPVFFKLKPGAKEAPAVDLAANEAEDGTKAIEEQAFGDTASGQALESAYTDTKESDVKGDVSESSETLGEDGKPDLPAEGREPVADWDTSRVDVQWYVDRYPETVAWLYFEDGSISYPVMKDGDNEKYRSIGSTGEEAWTGAIFLDYRSSSDLTDPNSIIYGHNMKDRTMFGTLRDYRDVSTFFDDHRYFQVITPDKACRYQVFIYMDVPNSFEIYDYVGEKGLEFVSDAEPVMRKSYRDSEITLSETDRVVTLSTCTDKDRLRFVVLGVLVDEQAITDQTEESEKFTYVHDPRDNPEAMADILENPDAIYGFSPDPESERLAPFAQYDWTDPEVVAERRKERKSYHESMDSMMDILENMRAAGASVEDMARAVSKERNRVRIESYKDDPVGLNRMKESNLNTYGNEEGPSADDLYEKCGSWELVIQKAFGTNMGMDACCGLYDDYYDLYKELGYVE
ncbi:MAG: sortase [Oribacterium sp.]|nr:sortase [Oribacterium sp.]